MAANYDSVKSNAWLLETAKNPRWVGNQDEVKPREKVSLLPEGARLKIAKTIADQGWIPHHENPTRKVSVASVAEALIIIDYVARCKADSYTAPQEVPRMNADEEAEVNRWMQNGRM